MVNYSNTKIYKIWSTQGPMIYVGSTTKEYLSQRMDSHRGDYSKWKNGKKRHTTSFKLFDEYGIENCFIELLEAKSCCDNHEKSRLEGKYIRELECVNKVIPARTYAEYREDNKEKIKQYRVENRDKAKAYKEANKDKIKAQNKLYNELHKDKRIANKDKINARKRQLRKEKKMVNTPTN